MLPKVLGLSESCILAGSETILNVISSQLFYVWLFTKLAEHFPRLTKIVTGLGIRSTRRRKGGGPLWGIKKRMEEGVKGTASLLKGDPSACGLGYVDVNSVSYGYSPETKLMTT